MVEVGYHLCFCARRAECLVVCLVDVTIVNCWTFKNSAKCKVHHFGTVYSPQNKN